ncbi:LOW QUALITY PROTEIN: uncharacterized protein LOC118757247 [Rhagoletis pomonella]|uniref:LOW QUALITY PROTEIN: uncharacterized protein LOC118757247 n=1 Tax=Rhagoletis pomonella TaxID=28610 RepID=UPI00177E19F3|nr:LOW QUALITY PROTEIN: uncharacterized protein LOC118757247 [Rhagoletis pomonella]
MEETNAETMTIAQKYVSMFRIDGVPILPPLITQEKRRQMQKLKEKAVKVEQRLEECRRRRGRYNLEYSTVGEELKLDQTGGSNNHDISSSSSSSVSEHIKQDNQHEEVEKSYLLLSDLLVQNEVGSSSIIPNQNNCKMNRQASGEARNNDLEIIELRSSETNLMQRMQKLKKSETLIIEHGSNTLLTPLSEDEIQLFQQQQQQINLDHPKQKPLEGKVYLYEVDEDENPNFQIHQRPKPCMDKSLMKIPSICIDPPTPITATCTFSDSINQQCSIDIINVNNDKKASKETNKSLMEEYGSDESFNYTGSTTNLERDLKTHRKVTNITSKIIKFENFSTTEQKEDTAKCSNIRPPQRSATSPSLNAGTSERTQIAPDSLGVTHGSQSHNGLVRSNSFTLEGPSEALIEHIRQQKLPPNNNYPTKRLNLFSISATRDTVESKAKRVQKIDLKSRSVPTRFQLKPSTTNITTPSLSHSTNNKIKRSPYEQKVTKPKMGRQLKKSACGTSSIKQMKTRTSMPSIPSDKKSTEVAREPATNNLHFNDIETEHRQKFLELLAHQKKEQQRMHQLFEEQQQHLLEQLTAKMSSANICLKNVNDNGSLDNSPSAKPILVATLSLQSPTITANSSVASNSMDSTTGICELSSLELSACSSTIPTTSQSSNRCTPRRRLFSRDFSPSASLCSNNIVDAQNVNRSNGTTPGRSGSRYKAENSDLSEEARRRAAAVTKINAHVRGYLVRRLFQTEQIQRIVQTIKDTLIFVFSLHMETMYDPVEAKAPDNVILKARLLRQLTSTMHTLHLILFQTTVKERMEIISRDRKRIKTKMLTLSMKRTPTFRT